VRDCWEEEERRKEFKLSWIGAIDGMMSVMSVMMQAERSGKGTYILDAKMYI